MRVMLLAAMALLLLRPGTAMAAVSDSCRLFVTAVLPGLLPYMVLSSMLLSRCRSRSPLLLTLLGWCGGSPAGARLLGMTGGLTRRQQAQISVSVATMSPMFLVGTCGGWLGSARAGMVMLVSVLAGGGVAGALAAVCTGRSGQMGGGAAAEAGAALPFGAAVEQAARTLLLVCGTMAMWRMFAALAAEALPAQALILTTLLEATAGIREISALPLPLPLRTAMAAGAAGLGGVSIGMQNRAVLQQGSARDVLSLPGQALWQAVHGGVSALLALGLMQLWGG